MLLLFSTQKTTPTSTASTRQPVIVYLMERLGFSEVESLSIFNKLLRLRGTADGKQVQVTDLISFEKSNIVITYLQEYCGLDLSHIKKAVTKHLPILGTNVDKTLRPKVKLLQDLGFSTSDLALVLISTPRLYLEYDWTPVIQALRSIMGCDKDVFQFCKRLKYGSASTILSNLIPNVTMLKDEYGIPRDEIRVFMIKRPHPIIGRTEWLRDVLVRMEDKWGITRDSIEFLRAVHVFCGHIDEKINSKCQLFRSYGWSYSDVLSLIKRFPTSLGLSEAGIKNKLEFYMNELGYEPAFLASRPALLGYSLENKVVPRYKVLSILKENELIKTTYQLYHYILMSEDRFLNRYVLPYEKILPNLRDVYSKRSSPSEVPLLKEANGNGS